MSAHVFRFLSLAASSFRLLRSALRGADMKKYTVVERGTPNDSNYRVYIMSDEGPISPFHDIPLYVDKEQQIFNMVVEVPRWTNAKMEIATKEKLNPIKQDTEKGELRYVPNIFPYHGFLWNYGALPQTWEEPSRQDGAINYKGDNDPVDVLEIGSRLASTGEVLSVKVLGVIGLIDEEEADWKLIAIDTNDPMAAKLSNVADVETHMPGLISASVKWLSSYKIPDGKPLNQVAFGGEPKDKDFALEIIDDCHNSWRNLVEAKVPLFGIDIDCVTVENAAQKLVVSQARKILEKAPAFGQRKPLDSDCKLAVASATVPCFDVAQRYFYV